MHNHFLFHCISNIHFAIVLSAWLLSNVSQYLNDLNVFSLTLILFIFYFLWLFAIKRAFSTRLHIRTLMQLWFFIYLFIYFFLTGWWVNSHRNRLWDITTKDNTRVFTTQPVMLLPPSSMSCILPISKHEKYYHYYGYYGNHYHYIFYSI